MSWNFACFSFGKGGNNWLLAFYKTIRAHFPLFCPPIFLILRTKIPKIVVFQRFCKMNRGYIGNWIPCFYQFYARLLQIITRFLQNESVSLFSRPQFPRPWWARARERVYKINWHPIAESWKGEISKSYFNNRISSNVLLFHLVESLSYLTGKQDPVNTGMTKKEITGFFGTLYSVWRWLWKLDSLAGMTTGISVNHRDLR
jgi:hypothetical protein